MNLDNNSPLQRAHAAAWTGVPSPTPAAACARSSGDDDYRAFLEAKVCLAVERGAPITDAQVNPILKPHQRAIVRWSVQGERRACFADYGRIGKGCEA